jgi:D-sedoheptulose 7-phosphate isomerase
VGSALEEHVRRKRGRAEQAENGVRLGLPGAEAPRSMTNRTVSDCVSTYLDEMVDVVKSIDKADVQAVVDRLFEGWRERRTTYIIGNGGSASTASHMMNDLNKMTSIEGAPRFRAIALTDNMPYITAIGNDIEYADIFVEQLRNLLLPHDILIVISGSGNSENVIRGANFARTTGATVIGLCGRPGSRLCECADAVVTVPAKSICQQEDGHLMLNHAIALALRERIAATV